MIVCPCYQDHFLDLGQRKIEKEQNVTETYKEDKSQEKRLLICTPSRPRVGRLRKYVMQTKAMENLFLWQYHVKFRPLRNGTVGCLATRRVTITCASARIKRANRREQTITQTSDI